MSPSSNENPNKLIFGLAAIIIIAALAGGTVYVKKSNKDSTTTATGQATIQSSASSTEPTTTDSSSTTSTSTSSTASYKDGSYTASNTYDTPGGQAGLSVTLTVSGGSVTAVSITQDAAERDSKFYQQSFLDSYKSAVVGKSINGLSLSRVAGASLTTQGFNDALDTIRSKAQA